MYEYSLNVSNVLRHIEHDINSAKEYIWLMADQSVIAGPSIDQAIGNRDVCVSIIIPKSSLTPEEYQQIKRLLRDKLEMKLVPEKCQNRHSYDRSNYKEALDYTSSSLILKILNVR